MFNIRLLQNGPQHTCCHQGAKRDAPVLRLNMPNQRLGNRGRSGRARGGTALLPAKAPDLRLAPRRSHCMYIECSRASPARPREGLRSTVCLHLSLSFFGRPRAAIRSSKRTYCATPLLFRRSEAAWAAEKFTSVSEPEGPLSCTLCRIPMVQFSRWMQQTAHKRFLRRYFRIAPCRCQRSATGADSLM